MIKQTARVLKVDVRVITTSDAKGLEEVLQKMARAKPAGLIVFETWYSQLTRFSKAPSRPICPSNSPPLSSW